MILLHNFFLLSLTFSLALGAEKPEDNIRQASEIKRFAPTEKNPASNLDDDDIDTATVEELQMELSAERAKVRDLNQTIADILERMEEMERDIIKNEAKIIDTQSSVVLLSRDVEDLTDEVAGVQDDVVTVAEDVKRNSGQISNVTWDVVSLQASDQQQDTRIESLSLHGTWCGYLDGSWKVANYIVTYDSISYSSSNMEVSEPPLDVNTGNNKLLKSVVYEN